jgi:hypothetical protein
MSTYTIIKSEPVYIAKEAFTSGLSLAGFRVYCQICLISQQLKPESEGYRIASDCGISGRELDIAYQELEHLGFIKIIDTQITILDLTKQKFLPPARIPSAKEFNKNPDLYQSIPLWGESVYVICNPINGLVKIGISHKPRSRVKAIANKHKTDLVTLFVIPTHKHECLEKFLHEQFKSKQVDFAGEKEWFSLDGNDLSFFSSDELRKVISRIEEAKP